MASTNFSFGTIIPSIWLNEVNAAVYTTLPSKQDVAAKDASGGYVGTTGYAHNFWNSAGTYNSQLTNSNTAARTYTFPDKSGTVAMISDVSYASSLYLNSTYGGF